MDTLSVVPSVASATAAPSSSSSDTAASVTIAPNTTMNGNNGGNNISHGGGGGVGVGSRMSEAARKELRQSRIGSSSSMDSTSSTMLFRKSYPSNDTNASFSSSSVAGSIMDLNADHSHLTQAELEDYSRSYFGQQGFHHQKQSSYAQSEGYHSYVSSSDSSSATPFLDRLRQETELLSRASSHWSDLQSTSSACSSSASNLNASQPPLDNASSESTSSSETLKWLGSMSDVSVSSHATNSSAVSGSVSTSQLIAHSSRVMTPKRHNSESVLYMTEDQLNAAQAAADQSHFHTDHHQPIRDRFSRRSNMPPVYAVNQYSDEHTNASMLPVQMSPNRPQPMASRQTVADRISELERQNAVPQAPIQGHFHKAPSAAMHQKYTFLDPSKTTRVPNPTLKAIQKKAVQSYFDRQQSTNSIREPVATRQSMVARPQSLPLTSSSHTSTVKPVNPSRSSLPSNYAAQHFPSPRHSPPSPVAATNVSGASINSSPVLPKSHNIAATSAPLGSPTSTSIQTSSTTSHTAYPVTFHQAATSYNASAMMPCPPASIVTRTNGDTSQMAPANASFNDDSMNESGVPPPPPRRNRSLMPVRRTSSAAEYSAYRDHNLKSNSQLAKGLLTAMVIGPTISLDDWVPERPPKNPSLRIPSPDLPPPPPSTHVVVDELVNDEPLPPPPPELLRHVRQLSEPDTKPLPPSRRNSFAGSSNKKNPFRSPITTESTSPLATPLPASPQSSPPPAIPRKSVGLPPLQDRPPMQYPSYAQKAQPQRPTSSMSKYPHHPVPAPYHATTATAHTFQSAHHDDDTTSPATSSERTSENSRVTMRKRTHNAQLTSIEMPAVNAKLMPAHSGPHHHHQPQPPPLKPRLPVHTTDPSSVRSVSSMGARLRSNSKASYLPRQSREKLNVDPDHGVYKLTLTSNEDFVNHNNNNNNQSAYHHHKSADILGPKFNNLPDVLPVGAKIHSPSQPPTPHYGSNNNIHSGTHGHMHQQQQQPIHSHYNHAKGPQTAPPHPQLNSTGYSMKSIFNFNRSTSANGSASTSPSSPPLNNTFSHRDVPNSNHHHPESILSKMVSQSSIDLMKTHILNVSTTNESHLKSPVQNGHSPTLSSRHQSPQSGAVRPELGRKLSLEDRTNNFNNSPSISRSASTVTSAKKESDARVIRKDSLKENIDKITQLQTQLMSAHLYDQEKHIVGLKRESSFRSQSVEPVARIVVDEGRKSPSDSVPTPMPVPTSPPPAVPTLSSSPIHNAPATIERASSKSPTSKPQPEEEVALISDTLTSVPTAEAASQTDESALSSLTHDSSTLSDHMNGFGNHDLLDDMVDKQSTSPNSVSSIDLDCTKLTQELVRHLAPSDRLNHILMPKSFRSSSYYVTGLYNPYIAPRAVKKDVGTSTPSQSPVHSHSTTPILSTTNSPPPSPVSPVPHFNREITTLSTDDTDQYDVGDLTRMKEELVARLTSRIAVLSREQSAIADEMTANERLGVNVARRVTEQIRPVDANKYRSYVNDVGDITMLLLSLSGRLARTENELQIVEVGDSERKSLETKRDRLVEKLEEAKLLKEDIDRRGSVVCRILEQHLTIDGYADYDYFINTKAKLIVNARELMDKVQVDEDQLNALKETLVHSEC